MCDRKRVLFLVPQDWQSVDREAFTIRANNQRSFNLKELIEEGNYNTLMQNQPLYDSSAHTFESSHDSFRSAFNEGFPWELIEVFSGTNRKALKLTVDPPIVGIYVRVSLFRRCPVSIGHKCSNVMFMHGWDGQ